MGLSYQSVPRPSLQQAQRDRCGSRWGRWGRSQVHRFTKTQALLRPHQDSSPQPPECSLAHSRDHTFGPPLPKLSPVKQASLVLQFEISDVNGYHETGTLGTVCEQEAGQREVAAAAPVTP